VSSDFARGAPDETARLPWRSTQCVFSSKEKDLVKNHLSSVRGKVQPRPRMLAKTARRQQAPTKHHPDAPRRAWRPDVALHRVFCLRPKTRTLNQIFGAWGFHALHVGWHDSLERPAVLPCPCHRSALSTGRVCSPVLVFFLAENFLSALPLPCFVESRISSCLCKPTLENCLMSVCKSQALQNVTCKKRLPAASLGKLGRRSLVPARYFTRALSQSVSLVW
jgi:hypothetical protein